MADLAPAKQAETPAVSEAEQQAAQQLQKEKVGLWRDAAEAVVRLQDAPNQERRGRTTDAAAERIEKFVKKDSVYLAARNEYAQDSRALKIEFRETIERSLSILERLASRNSDIDLPVDLGEKHKYVYRMVALHLLLERQGYLDNDPGEKSILGLKSFTRPELPGASTVPTAVTEAEVSEGKEAIRTEPEAVPTPEEERLFDLTMAFLTERLDSIKSQHELLRGLTTFQDGKSFPFLRTMLTGSDLPHGILLEQLQEVGRVADECKQFGDGSLHSVSSACELHKKVRLLTKNWGLTLIEDPFAAMQQDEFLSPSGKSRLVRSFEVMRDADPIARDIIAAVEKKYLVTPEHVAELSEAVTRFRLAGKEEDFIRSRLDVALSVGPKRIAHINNCAALATRKVHIDDLLVLSPEGASIVARAAAGIFDVVPQTDSHYPKSVRGRIDVEIRILRNAEPKLKSDFDEALSQIVIPANVNKSEIRDMLFTIAGSLAPENRPLKLVVIGDNLKTLAAAGGNLKNLHELFRAPQEGVGISGLTDFVSELARLHLSGATGIPAVLNNACTLAEQRRRGNEKADIRGVLTEAKIAVNLERAGYKILAMSATLPSTNYDYDILAISPTGERLGIEVKRGLGTLVGKNEGMWKEDKHDNAQLVRFMKACGRDDFTPCLAFAHFGEDAWAQTGVSDLLSQLGAEFGKRPRMLDGRNGKVVG